MIFKTKATLSCVDCGIVKTFDAESDVMASTLNDSVEIKGWDGDITLNTLNFEGLCPNCKYNKAA